MPSARPGAWQVCRGDVGSHAPARQAQPVGLAVLPDEVWALWRHQHLFSWALEWGGLPQGHKSPHGLWPPAASPALAWGFWLWK